MTRQKDNRSTVDGKAVIGEQTDYLKPWIEEIVPQVLEAEMIVAVGAEHHERTGERKGYRSGYYTRGLVTRVGKLELRIPQDRQGRFSTELFNRYERNEQALVAALAEMYIQGVSTRKVKAITEELCGHEFSASTVSEMNKSLDEALEAFAHRRLEKAYPYLILDARYEKVREGGIVRSQALMVALGINEEGRREVLAVELANRESESSWKALLLSLKERGLHGVEYVVSDDQAGLRQSIREVLWDVPWQRCYVHFLRNALDYLPQKADPDCLSELRAIYDRPCLEEARQDLEQWFKKWAGKFSKLCNWVEANIEETLTFYQLPREHRQQLRSTNMLERLHEEIKRRTQVVRIFPNEVSCLRLIRALATEMDEGWGEQPRYVNMELLKEQKKPRMVEAVA
jgi:putative transposase